MKSVTSKDMYQFPCQVMTPDALRMRLTRLCQKRKKNACHVDEATHKEWKEGGERREWLELALLEVLKHAGTDNGPGHFKKVKAGVFRSQGHASVSSAWRPPIYMSYYIYKYIKGAFINATMGYTTYETSTNDLTSAGCLPVPDHCGARAHGKQGAGGARILAHAGEDGEVRGVFQAFG